jgi:LAGLIDADG DNA endonuclease family
MFELPNYYLSVVIGLAISDVGFQFTKYKGKINSCRIALEMSYKSLSFLLSTFLILSPFCSALPKLHKRYRAGSINIAVSFYTRSLPCFLKLSKLFFYKQLFS